MKTYKINDNLKFICETDLEKWRCETFFTKEPETLYWIEKEMINGGVFFDVGANIGVYALYAASLYPNLAVYAFEPHDANFARLVENVRINGFHNVHPWKLALGNRQCEEKFYINSTIQGSSGHQLSQPIDENGRYFLETDLQMVRLETVDNLVLHGMLPYPGCVKIDVDGAEYDIVRGMKGCLYDLTLRSVLVEVNRNRDEICRLFFDNNFGMANEYNRLDNHSRLRREAAGNRAENIVFTRNDLMSNIC